MTVSEAIEEIEYLCDEYKDKCGGYPYEDYELLAIAAFDMAAEALEKQVPQKPIYRLRASENDYYDCPACHEYLLSDYRQNVCHHCGQAIDWRTTE